MKPPASESARQSVWLDTDIGDDTDDILALALVAASPELSLAGVSTVFGDTVARARLAQTLLATLGRHAASIPVAAGCGQPLPGTASPEFWPNGPMPRASIAQLACAYPVTRLPALATKTGVDALAEQLRLNPGRTVPIAIGPLTNLATLLLREPALKSALPRLVVMGGEFDRPQWEWNIRCDPLAAACVAESGVPIDFIPWSIGMACTVSPGQLDRLFQTRTRTGRLLARAVRLWRAAKPAAARAERPHLFDPMAVATLLRPNWFRWERGRVRVSFAPATFAHTFFTLDPRGPHRIARRVKAGPALRSVWSRLLAL